ncbi:MULTISPECIES: TolC family protein [Cyanophyceae]|uniref:TolC family protein n=1 Tax=Cyanophyceae TaxID=3028117 RepID=UPI0016852DB6|nr:TolC family protein [Trichocoleus sp. FACHB-69]MBD1933843.1 TolC family protein [Trichocoleus sp. FACHB-69]
MPTSRHPFHWVGTGFMAVGAGLALTLAYAKLSAAQESPPSQKVETPKSEISTQENKDEAETRPTSPMLNSGNGGMAPSAPQKNQQAQETGNGSNVVTQQSSETKTQNPPLPPEYLNPSANPLLFPTKPEEVQIQNFQRITLEQALVLARRNNRDLQVALLTAERSRAALREALAAEYPNIGVQANFTRSDSASAELSNARQQSSPLRPALGDDNTVSTSFDSRFEVSYDLFTSGRRGARIQAAEQQARFDQLDLERQLEQVRLDVTNSYYDLQEADSQVEISTAAVRDAARSLEDAQLLEQAGLGTRFDVLRFQVQLANAVQDLTRTRSQQSIARRQLTQLLSLAQRAEVAAADQVEFAGEWNLTLEQSIILALKNRAELEQLLARRNISEQQRRIALAGTSPQVSLFATYDVLGVFNDELGPADGLTLGARFRWDFFDGGAARARAEQERANIAIAETQFADQRNQIRLEVERAYFNLRSNAENIQTAFFAVTQAEESLRLAELRFRSGVGTQTDVISAQTELTRARVNRLRAVLDYNRSLAALQRNISNLPGSELSDNPL